MNTMRKQAHAMPAKLKKPLPRTGRLGKAHQQAPAPQSLRAPKLSVSLYQPDLRRLDEIKAYMGEQGFRNLSDSEAIRLFIRSGEITGAIVSIYQEMQLEDGRRK
jgi:hypothetical protein